MGVCFGGTLPAMPKLNIYVSADLKAQMDRHPDQHWSNIAQLAFQQTLHDLHKGGKGISYITEKDVIWMIRASLESLDSGRKEREEKERSEGFDDMTMDLSSDGRTMVFRVVRNGREKTFEIVCPWQIYKAGKDKDDQITRFSVQRQAEA